MVPGSRLGAYEILGLLGEGGMGQVYRARDTQLDRDVAIKILPDLFAADPDRVMRFEREAKAIAALNHPNIAQIHGVERSGTTRALVMEFVEGEDLAELIARGPVRPEQAIAIARQTAAALEAAHEAGLIHRDLKPANVKVRDDGTVKVLDFGLAKANPTRSPVAAAEPRVDLATSTSPAITEVGLILGTAAYMSPEQARGRPADKRADIWAFGAVLFELLSGERLFAGTGSVTETIAAVIKDDLRLDRLPSATPPALRTLIARCLERDPAERLRDIGEARILLSRPLDRPDRPAARILLASGSGRWRHVVPFAVAVIIAAAAAAATWLFKPPAAAPLRTLDLAVPPRLRDVAISNDGTRLAYLSGNELYVRRLDELEPKPLGPMHVTARELVWAPDDTAIAFVANAGIQTIPLAGGPPFVVTKLPASATNVVGLAWLPDGTIVFSAGFGALYGAPATGGPATVQLAPDPNREIDFHELAALPDNRLIVSTHLREEDANITELIELTGARRRVILTRDPDVGVFRYVPNAGGGTLVFARQATNAGIWSVPFEENEIDISRSRLLVPGATRHTVSRDGTLVVSIPARERRALVWVDATGAESPVPGEPVEVPVPDLELSPDGGRAAFVLGDSRTAGPMVSVNGVVVVRDLQTGIDTRLATPVQASNWGDVGGPTWSPDGRYLIHRVGQVGRTSLVQRRSDVAGQARTLVAGTFGRLLSDGTLIYTGSGSDRGLRRMVIDGDPGRSHPSPVLEPGETLNVRDLDLSPDGRLIAFAALGAGGRSDVFVAQVANPGEQWLVQEGGTRPRFTRDGSRLYVTRGVVDQAGRPQGQLVGRTVAMRPRIAFGPPEVVLKDHAGGLLLSSYDVALDGKRFLMFKPVEAAAVDNARLILVQGAIERPAAR